MAVEQRDRELSTVLLCPRGWVIHSLHQYAGCLWLPSTPIAPAPMILVLSRPQGLWQPIEPLSSVSPSELALFLVIQLQVEAAHASAHYLQHPWPVLVAF